jgi:hypothetical protein
VNDRASTVRRLKRSPRNYAVLGDLNTQPRTTYLARVSLRAREARRSGDERSPRLHDTDRRGAAPPPLRLGRGGSRSSRLGLVGLLGLTLGASLYWGVGLWGINIPFVWGFDLINYAWWIGIATARACSPRSWFCARTTCARP